MPVTIPVGGGTFTAVEGETYILSPDTTGSITFTGDASFTVEVNGNQTGGIVDNQFVMSFGAGTDPTVTYAAGIDASSHQINADGDSLTVNIGDGATVGQINANSVSDPAGFVLTAGNDVSVIGSVNGSVLSGAESSYTVGSNFSTTGNLVGSAAGDTTMSIGDGLDVGGRLTASGTGDSVLTIGSNASIGNSLDLRGSGDRSATFGDNASITGNVDVRSTGLDKSVVFGSNASVTGDVNFLTGLTTGTAFFKSGDDLSVNGNFVTSDAGDNVIIGNNWLIGGNIDVRLGDDQVSLGWQGTTDPSIISGSVGTGDGLTVAAPPGQEAAFIAAATTAGWTDNGDGTVSAAPGATNFTYNNHTYTAWETAGNPICFTTGTQITVADGETVNVEDLAPGDMVMTADHGLQPVKWIGAKTFGAAKLAARENIRPIRIAAGALGGGIPARDLLVSPQHRMLVRSKIAQRMFSEDEILVAAKHLVLLDGVDVADDVPEVAYVHFLCDTHEIVFGNGAASESLYTGPQALKSVSQEAASEIMAIFPELANIDYRPLSAHQIVNGRLGRKLAMRHMKNRRTLMAERLEIAQPNL